MLRNVCQPRQPELSLAKTLARSWQVSRQIRRAMLVVAPFGRQTTHSEARVTSMQSVCGQMSSLSREINLVGRHLPVAPFIIDEVPLTCAFGRDGIVGQPHCYAVLVELPKRGNKGQTTY